MFQKMDKINVFIFYKVLFLFLDHLHISVGIFKNITEAKSAYQV